MSAARLTADQLEVLIRKRQQGLVKTAPPQDKKLPIAKGRLKSPEMNKLEKTYSDYLELEKQAGRILWYAFEAMKFRLADNTFYTPDFIVMLATGEMEAHETKGYWRDDARVKIKVAASMFPLRFRGIQARPKSQGGGWLIEVFDNA